jgi:hypothetical protein
MTEDKIIILDGVGNEVRTYNVRDNGQACKEQGKTLRELAKGFCSKPDNQLKGFHIAGTRGGTIDLTEPVDSVVLPEEEGKGEEGTNLEDLSIEDLKAEAKARKIEFAKNVSKKKLIELITADEEKAKEPADVPNL